MCACAAICSVFTQLLELVIRGATKSIGVESRLLCGFYSVQKLSERKSKCSNVEQSAQVTVVTC